MSNKPEHDDLAGGPPPMVGLTATIKHAEGGICPRCKKLFAHLLPETGMCAKCSAETDPVTGSDPQTP